MNGACEQVFQHALDIVDILQFAVSNELTDLLLGQKLHVASLPL
ncbi:FAD linked oxidase domain-containing protein [Alicyclobacillus hesperidum URH17-3-68]|nr:FAD linked oxidase domain-containing protein [Alicyclobacillus hesperidum URH17-3-68]